MKRGNHRWLRWAAAGLAVAGLFGWLLAPRAERADIAPVTRGPLVVTLDEEGETRVRERFLVSAPVAGRLLRIELEPGDPVVAEESVLAIFQPVDATPLDPRSRAVAEEEVRAHEAELERAKHERARAQAELHFAERDYARARRLAEEGALSTERLEVAQLEEQRAGESLDAFQHAVVGASHRLARARAKLLNMGAPDRDRGDPLSIRAPVDGVVLRRVRESESVVAAGDPLLEVGNPRDLEVVTDYLSRDAVKIRPGARAEITRWGGDTALEGVVRRVEPSGFTKISALGVEEQRVNIVLDFTTPAPERVALGDGFRVETRIVVWESEDTLRVPAGSLFRRGDDWAVFAYEAGRAVFRRVELGARTPVFAEVLSGLAPGDRVITYPGDGIREGVRVLPRGAPD